MLRGGHVGESITLWGKLLKVFWSGRNVMPGHDANAAIENSGEPRFDGEIDRLRPLAGFDLLAIGGLHARDFEAPIGADHGKTVGFDHGDFADPAGDAPRVFRR